ncbi:MAG TPA: helix-turn-helix domain-containing protein [Acidimicrobiales bacterium]
MPTGPIRHPGEGPKTAKDTPDVEHMGVIKAQVVEREPRITALREELERETRDQGVDMALLSSWGLSYRRIAAIAGVVPQTVINRVTGVRPEQVSAVQSAGVAATVRVEPVRTKTHRTIDINGSDKRPKFFTVGEVAEALKMSTKTVRRRIADGSLKAARIGSSIRIAEADLLEFMEKSRGRPHTNPKLRIIKKRKQP